MFLRTIFFCSLLVVSEVCTERPIKLWLNYGGGNDLPRDILVYPLGFDVIAPLRSKYPNLDFGFSIHGSRKLDKGSYPEACFKMVLDYDSMASDAAKCQQIRSAYNGFLSDDGGSDVLSSFPIIGKHYLKSEGANDEETATAQADEVALETKKHRPLSDSLSEMHLMVTVTSSGPRYHPLYSDDIQLRCGDKELPANYADVNTCDNSRRYVTLDQAFQDFRRSSVRVAVFILGRAAESAAAEWTSAFAKGKVQHHTVISLSNSLSRLSSYIIDFVKDNVSCPLTTSTPGPNATTEDGGLLTTSLNSTVRTPAPKQVSKEEKIAILSVSAGAAVLLLGALSSVGLTWSWAQH